MTERKKIEERLRKKEQELQGLEEKLRIGRGYVQALHDVLKLISEDDAAEDATAEAVLRAGSAVDQARDAILKLGRPVHVNDLLIAQGKGISREHRASLTSSLAAYVRRGEIFTRTAPNTFGLAELGHEMAEMEDETAEPSAGFGRIAPPRPPSPPATPADLDDDIPF